MMICEIHRHAEGVRTYPGQRCPWCERDGLAALVGTIRWLTGCKVRNVADITPEQHSHEIMEQFDKLKLQIQELQKCADSYHTTRGCCRALAAHQAKTEKRVASSLIKNERHDCEHCVCSCSDCSNRCPHGIKVGDGPC